MPEIPTAQIKQKDKTACVIGWMEINKMIKKKKDDPRIAIADMDSLEDFALGMLAKKRDATSKPCDYLSMEEVLKKIKNE